MRKVPCLYPLADGRRCAECLACQQDVVWRHDYDRLLDAVGDALADLEPGVAPYETLRSAVEGGAK